jgi:CRISPR system Cascade subunit CasD
MKEAVRLRIEAPLVSWSEAGVSYRPSGVAPSWSALVGMLGAALGWGRDDPRLLDLAADYAPALQVRQAGDRLVDYHTIQTPHRPALKGRRVRTRADELRLGRSASGDPHTTITRREYVMDARYDIVVVPLNDAPVADPGSLASALVRPVYPLSAGRRSCLLGWVPAEVVGGERVEDWLPQATHWDARLPSGLPCSVVTERRDLLAALAPRRFKVREEAVA